MPPRAFLVLLALAVLTVGGCARLESRERGERLGQATEAYAKSIRWGDHATAAAFLRLRDGTVPPAPPPPGESLKVVDYSIDMAPVSEQEVRMVARFRYYWLESARVRTSVSTGTWWYDEESGAWFLDGTLPSFAP